MRVQELLERIETRFSGLLRQMNTQEILLAEQGAERIRLRVFTSRADTDFPLSKVAFMLLENGWVWNKDDKTLLDADEIIVGSFIPVDALPLPILALEASLHIGKYDHLNVDIFPLSKDEGYRSIFCEPVKTLRRKHDGLPGLLPGVRTPSLLGEYTSQGMLAGDFSVELRGTTIPWWFAYVDLYNDFLMNRDTFAVLSDPATVAESREVKELFLSRFRKDTPRILSDIPHLYSQDRGHTLGKLLF